MYSSGRYVPAVASRSIFHVKWNHFGVWRRFQILKSDWFYSSLMKAIHEFEPSFNHSLTYTDDDGDKIHFSTDVEMSELVTVNSNDGILIIESAEKPQSSTVNMERLLHPNIVCDVCDQDIRGTRYKCLVCDDFDLCEGCEKSGTHAQHAMLRLASPDTPKPYQLFYGAGAVSHRHARHHERLARRESRDMARAQVISEQMRGSHERQLAEQHRLSSKFDGIRKKTEAQKKRIGEGSLRRNPEMNEQSRGQCVGHGINAFKSFGAQLQTALTNMGIERETAVEDRAGEVIGRQAPPSSAAAGSPAEPVNAVDAGLEQNSNPLSFGPKQTVKRKSEEQSQSGAAAKTPKPAKSNPVERLTDVFKTITDFSSPTNTPKLAEPFSTEQIVDAFKTITEVTSDIIQSYMTGMPNSQADQQAQAGQHQESHSQPGQLEPQKQKSSLPDTVAGICTEAAMAASSYMSMSSSDEIKEMTNRCGLNLFNKVKKDFEHTIMPIIDGVYPMPPSPARTETAQETSEMTTPTDMTKQPTPGSSGVATSSVNNLYPALNDMTAQPSQHQLLTEAGGIETIFVETPLVAVTTGVNFESKNHKNENNNDSTENTEDDVDIINLDEVNQAADANEPAQPEAYPQVDTSVQPQAGESDDVDSIASLYRVEPTRMNNISSSSEEDDDEWMVVKKTSYKTLCDFYEQRRRENSSPSAVELHDVRVVPNEPPKEKAPDSMDPLYHNLVNDMLTALGVNNMFPQQLLQQQLQQQYTQEQQLQEQSISHQVSSVTPVTAAAGEAPKKPAAEQHCYAGRPFYPLRRPHSYKCYVRHPNPQVQAAVDQLEAMGYDNCNGWLTCLAERHDGDISRVLDAAAEDALHVARVAADA